MKIFEVSKGYTILGVVATLKEAADLVAKEVERLRSEYPKLTLNHLETLVGNTCTVEIYQYNTLYKEVFTIERKGE